MYALKELNIDVQLNKDHRAKQREANMNIQLLMQVDIKKVNSSQVNFIHRVKRNHRCASEDFKICTEYDTFYL